MKTELKTERTQRNFRLSQDAKDYLKAIAYDMGISQSAVIEVIIREKADSLHIKKEIAEKIKNVDP